MIFTVFLAGKISKENFAVHPTKWSVDNTPETPSGNKFFGNCGFDVPCSDAILPP
jgi:hypothetical protein